MWLLQIIRSTRRRGWKWKKASMPASLWHSSWGEQSVGSFITSSNSSCQVENVSHKSSWKEAWEDVNQPSNVIRWLCLSLFCCWEVQGGVVQQSPRWQRPFRPSRCGILYCSKSFRKYWDREADDTIQWFLVTEGLRPPIWANTDCIFLNGKRLGSIIISHTCSVSYGERDGNEFSSIRLHLYIAMWACLTREACVCSSFRWQNGNKSCRNTDSVHSSIAELTTFYYCFPLPKLSYPSSLFGPRGKWDVSAES